MSHKLAQIQHNSVVFVQINHVTIIFCIVITCIGIFQKQNLILRKQIFIESQKLVYSFNALLYFLYLLISSIATISTRKFITLSPRIAHLYPTFYPRFIHTSFGASPELLRYTLGKAVHFPNKSRTWYGG